jgi:hypothetical protein
MHGATHYGCSSHINGGLGGCGNSARLHREKAEEGVLDGIRRIYLDPAVIEEGKRRARALIKSRTGKRRVDTRAPRIRALQEEIANLADAIAQGVLRGSPAIAARLRASEEQLADLEAQPAPLADVERLIPRLEEEIRAAFEELPRTLASGNVDLARQELKGYLVSIRVVAERERMLLYSERNAVQAALTRAAGGVARCPS